MPATPNALAAAHRARAIAAIARTRAASPAPIHNADGLAALVQIADLLDVAAHSLETEAPDQWDGIVVTNTMDWDASAALREADDIATDNPAIGFPPRFTQYVTAPVFGNDVNMPASLLPSGLVLSAREGDLFARLLTVHTHLRLTLLAADDDTTAHLETAFTLLRKHARLAKSIASEIARKRFVPAPVTAPGVGIPTPATMMALGRAHEEHGTPPGSCTAPSAETR
jgi:hypothetical protein